MPRSCRHAILPGIGTLKDPENGRKQADDNECNECSEQH